jgi:hypothetical protein
MKQNIFLREVKKIFPNATAESIKLGKVLMRFDFCWCYGEVSKENTNYGKQIDKINKMARNLK